jgi:hypothetical protein
MQGNPSRPLSPFNLTPRCLLLLLFAFFEPFFLPLTPPSLFQLTNFPRAGAAVNALANINAGGVRTGQNPMSMYTNNRFKDLLEQMKVSSDTGLGGWWWGRAEMVAFAFIATMVQKGFFSTYPPPPPPPAVCHN